MASALRVAMSRLYAIGKETLRSKSVLLGRFMLKQPAIRGAAGRLLDLNPRLKRRFIALLAGVSLGEVMPTATAVHLASLKTSEALSRTATEAYRLLRQQAK